MSVRGALVRTRNWFPHGRELPQDVWQRRHRVILGLLWVHVPALFVFGVVRGYGVTHVGAEIGVIASAAVCAGWRWRTGNRRVRMAMAVLGLVTASALLVHLSGGTIEAHFHFFVMIGVITMYEDWFPFLLAIGYVALHHGVVGVLDPSSVYNQPAAIRAPWKWAGIHAFFVLAASAAYLVSWRMSETERERAESFAIQVREAQLRQRQALEINDNIVQGLAVAKYALDAGEDQRAYAAVSHTLTSAREIISELLGADGSGAALGPGDLVREKPAMPKTQAS